MLFDAHVTVGLENWCNYTRLLSVACEGGNEEVVAWLLHIGRTKIGLVESSGQHPLFAAVRGGKREVRGGGRCA